MCLFYPDEKQQREKEIKERQRQTPARGTSNRRASTRQSPVVKVLTSATFIRGVLGIMQKVMK